MNIVDWAVSTMEDLGGLGVALLIFLENVFPPIPSEVILPLAGVAAAGQEHTFLGMLLWSLAGSLAGAWLLYGLGRLAGPERLRRAFIRLPLLNVDDYDRTVAWTEAHGSAGIFFGRMVPGIRSLISIPAGLFAMPLWRFTVLTLAGSAIWNSVFIALGYTLGENWERIEPYTNVFSKIVYAIIAAMILWWLIQRIRQVRRRRAKGLPDPDQKHLEELEAEQEQTEREQTEPERTEPERATEERAGRDHREERTR